jgi:hypothetical protein
MRLKRFIEQQPTICPRNKKLKLQKFMRKKTGISGTRAANLLQNCTNVKLILKDMQV